MPSAHEIVWMIVALVIGLPAMSYLKYLGSKPNLRPMFLNQSQKEDG